MVASQVQLNGDHWDDWLASKCPALLIRGRDSINMTATQFEEMAARRPITTMVTLNSGHMVHADDPAGFVQAVRTFLTCL